LLKANYGSAANRNFFSAIWKICDDIFVSKDSEIEDETLAERIWGLTEMFPETVRNITSTSVYGSINLTQKMCSWSKTALWVLGSSFTVLVLPVLCEQERSSMEEQQAQQQRQILLGPSATVSSAPFMPGMAAGPK
jgi:import receptor subunit TOM22